MSTYTTTTNEPASLSDEPTERQAPGAESPMALARYDSACRALAKAKAVDEVKDILDAAVAMRAYAKPAPRTARPSVHGPEGQHERHDTYNVN